MNETVTFLQDEFEKGTSGEKVQGITIIIDGAVKQVMDMIMEKDRSYKDYTSLVRDAFFDGLNQIVLKNQK